MDRPDIYARACALTRRESEVLALLCEGLDTRQIAERMVVSEHTAPGCERYRNGRQNGHNA